ncbi:MAG: hypothetical protein JKY54_00915 [Flavobacteriales bacterium]|nr:hypothetical protein [Flavobacteriales bacterium]
MKKLIYGILTLVFIVSLGSCKQRKLNRDTTTAIDVSMIEGGFNDIQKVAEDVMKEENLEGKSNGGFRDIYGTPTVTVTPAWPDTTFPKLITVDFGSGTTDWLGRERKGIITINASGMYKDSLAEFTITPSAYYIDDYRVDGEKIITNNGRNAAGNINFTIEINDGQITTPDGDIATWESLRNREWIAGESTNWITDGLSGIMDDEYSITGTADGINRLGRAFAANITSPLIVELDCKWITRGTFTLVPEDLDTRTIDYGAGTCDNDATVNISGRTYNVKMW